MLCLDVCFLLTIVCAVPASEQIIVLVTPVWNDSTRLAGFGPKLAEALDQSGLPVRWIVADDGSSSEEKEKVTKLVHTFRKTYPRVEAMLFEERSHKGGAIYAAWDACDEASWLAFVDADGAVDAPSMLHLMEEAVARGVKEGCVGVRHNSEQTPLQRPLGRLISFHLFAFLVRALVGIRYEDTQCGAKVIPAEGYRQVSGNLQERGFIFDVELLLALDLAGYKLKELRIPWREMPGGKVNPLRDAWGMIAGLLRIRRRYK
jgi:glycosyltransferase involved in cell wall biosynthesis